MSCQAIKRHEKNLDANYLLKEANMILTILHSGKKQNDRLSKNKQWLQEIGGDRDTNRKGAEEFQVSENVWDAAALMGVCHKPTECTKPRANPTGNRRLGAIMMRQ